MVSCVGLENRFLLRKLLQSHCSLISCSLFVIYLQVIVILSTLVLSVPLLSWMYSCIKNSAILTPEP